MRYLSIEEENIENGIGLRTVLWVSGCSIRCPGCHNPESWNFEAGYEFGDEQIAHIIETLDHDYVAGLTISGGNPFEPVNYQWLIKLCSEVKSALPNKTIWLYTGYELDVPFFTTRVVAETIEDVEHNDINSVLNLIDVVVDSPYIEELRDVSLAFCGSTNQRVIDCKKTIKAGEIVLYS